MLRISRLVLGLAVSTQVCTIWTSGFETNNQCHHIKEVSESPVVFVSSPYTEVSPSSHFTLGCRVCSQNHHKIKVSWERNGSVLSERDGVRIKRKHKSLYEMTVKKAKKEDLGDYSCLVNNPGHKTTKGTFHVGFVPVPPKLFDIPSGMNSSQQELSWEVTSPSIIINYEVKLRRGAVSGPGEDWVSVHVPASADTFSSPQTRTESYLLRGLEMGTRYQVKVRARNKFGYSLSSEVLTFSTYSPYTTTSPPPTRAPQLIDWRENKNFQNKTGTNQLPSSSEILGTKRAQELAAFSSSPLHQLVPQFVFLSLLLCVL